MEYFEGLTDDSNICFPEDEFIAHDLVLFLAMTNSIGNQVTSSGFKEVLITQSTGVMQAFIQDELQAIFGEPLEGRKWFAKLARQDAEGQRSIADTVDVATLI